jgi:hypothetical protein
MDNVTHAALGLSAGLLVARRGGSLPAAAVAALGDAGDEWRAYAAAMEAQYAPVVVYARTGLAVRSELQAAVDNDVAIARAAQGGDRRRL